MSGAPGMKQVSPLLRLSSEKQSPEHLLLEENLTAAGENFY
jgi:hypothetical protein